jgi:hypothetical protein
MVVGGPDEVAELLPRPKVRIDVDVVFLVPTLCVGTRVSGLGTA